jgi:uncharacterized membrane-anchored protein
MFARLIFFVSRRAQKEQNERNKWLTSDSEIFSMGLMLMLQGREAL